MTMDPWLEYLQIAQHPFLDRFSNPSRAEHIYADAALGIAPMMYGRPENWYGRVPSSSLAIERLGEMALDVMNHLPEAADDMLLILEESECEESIDLLDRILAHYPENPFSKRVPDVGSNAPLLASEKQRALLRKLGVKNFSGTRAEASAMIDKLKTW